MSTEILKDENYFLQNVSQSIKDSEFEAIKMELQIKHVLDVIRHKDSTFLEKCLFVELNTKKRSDALNRMLQKYRKTLLERTNEEFIFLCRKYGVFGNRD